MRKPGPESNPPSSGTTRRHFLARSLGAAALATASARAAEALVAVGRTFRAVVFGHTGHGDYGHEHDLIFSARKIANLCAAGMLG